MIRLSLIASFCRHHNDEKAQVFVILNAHKRVKNLKRNPNTVDCFANARNDPLPYSPSAREGDCLAVANFGGATLVALWLARDSDYNFHDVRLKLHLRFN